MQSVTALDATKCIIRTLYMSKHSQEETFSGFHVLYVICYAKTYDILDKV